MLFATKVVFPKLKRSETWKVRLPRGSPGASPTTEKIVGPPNSVRKVSLCLGVQWQMGDNHGYKSANPSPPSDTMELDSLKWLAHPKIGQGALFVSRQNRQTPQTPPPPSGLPPKKSCLTRHPRKQTSTRQGAMFKPAEI